MVWYHCNQQKLRKFLEISVSGIKDWRGIAAPNISKSAVAGVYIPGRKEICKWRVGNGIVFPQMICKKHHDGLQPTKVILHLHEIVLIRAAFSIKQTGKPAQSLDVAQVLLHIQSEMKRL